MVKKWGSKNPNRKKIDTWVGKISIFFVFSDFFRENHFPDHSSEGLILRSTLLCWRVQRAEKILAENKVPLERMGFGRGVKR